MNNLPDGRFFDGKTPMAENENKIIHHMSHPDGVNVFEQINGKAVFIGGSYGNEEKAGGSARSEDLQKLWQHDKLPEVVLDSSTSQTIYDRQEQPFALENTRPFSTRIEEKRSDNSNPVKGY